MAKTARETLLELRWRPGRDLSRAEIWVLDRSQPGGGRVLSGAEVLSIGRRYLSTATAMIPLYKVVKIVVDGKAVFVRKPSTGRSRVS